MLMLSLINVKDKLVFVCDLPEKKDVSAARKPRNRVDIVRRDTVTVVLISKFRCSYSEINRQIKLNEF